MGDINYFWRRKNCAIPTGLNRADALCQRRVGGPESAKTGFKSLGEKKVTDLWRVLVRNITLERIAPNFFQGPTDALGVTRELHGGGVGQEFALT